jgi:predicted DNA-binding protein
MRLYSFRISRLMARRLNAVAKLYGAPPSTFVRDMVESTCGGDQAKTFAFLSRVQEGMTKQRQLDLLAHQTAVERDRGRIRDGTT